MITDILDYIGLSLRASNDYITSHAVNCIKDDNGQVLFEFDNGSDSEYYGITDNVICGMYLRKNGKTNYNYSDQRTRSCGGAMYRVQVPIRCAIFSTKGRYDVHAIEERLKYSLIGLNWSLYSGSENRIEIVLSSSETEFRKVFDEEIGRKYDSGSELMYMYIDFNINYTITAPKCPNDIEVCINQNCC